MMVSVPRSFKLIMFCLALSAAEEGAKAKAEGPLFLFQNFCTILALPKELNYLETIILTPSVIVSTLKFLMFIYQVFEELLS